MNQFEWQLHIQHFWRQLPCSQRVDFFSGLKRTLWMLRMVVSTCVDYSVFSTMLRWYSTMLRWFPPRCDYTLVKSSYLVNICDYICAWLLCAGTHREFFSQADRWHPNSRWVKSEQIGTADVFGVCLSNSHPSATTEDRATQRLVESMRKRRKTMQEDVVLSHDSQDQWWLTMVDDRRWWVEATNDQHWWFWLPWLWDRR